VARLQNVPINLGLLLFACPPVWRADKSPANDGSERTIDHVLLGTGYRVDVSSRFLAPELAQSISRFQGYPRSARVESSVPSGLHFLGAPAVWSFGPLMQFCRRHALFFHAHYFAASSGKLRAIAVRVSEPLVAELG